MKLLLAVFFAIVSEIAARELVNSTVLSKRQTFQSFVQQIAVGLVAPIHIVQSPRSGKVLFLERINGGDGSGIHAQEFDPLTGQSRPVTMNSDVFCSAGFISPDPLARIFNVGGWDGPALEAIRQFTPCGAPGVFGNCNWLENANIAALKVPRWYPSALPLANGRVAIIGGTTSATGLDPPALNQPNVEFVPPFVGEQIIELPLLVETNGYNLYPIAHLLPNGLVYIMAGERSQLLDPNTFQTVLELPPIVGKRTYPLAGGSVLLPLRPALNYAAEILTCGGGSDYNKLAPALETCGRIYPAIQGAQWVMEQMPFPRLMPDMTLLPDGTVFIANGAAFGWGGFDNAAEPIFTSLIYHPDFPLGQRFSIAATSNIARMYHSETLLLEDGRVLISGSTPNADANALGTDFPNEKRIEVFIPSYLTSGLTRPQFTATNLDWAYGQAIQLSAQIPTQNIRTLKAVLITNGFVTHSTHQGQRLVELVLNARRIAGTRFQLTIQSPPNAQILPPGWYMLFILDGPTPSVATWVRVGGDPAGIATWV